MRDEIEVEVEARLRRETGLRRGFAAKERGTRRGV
jgi:hypothetical protein